MNKKNKHICVLIVCVAVLQTAYAGGTQHLDKGSAYFEQGKYDEAIIEFTKAIESFTDYERKAIAYHRRSAAYREQGKYDEAIADHAQSVSYYEKDREDDDYLRRRRHGWHGRRSYGWCCL